MQALLVSVLAFLVLYALLTLGLATLGGLGPLELGLVLAASLVGAVLVHRHYARRGAKPAR